MTSEPSTFVLAPPPFEECVRVDRMGARERAHACWLALRANVALNPMDWWYHPSSDVVVVAVSAGRLTGLLTWSIVRCEAAATLGKIAEFYGPGVLAEADRQIGRSF